MKFRNRHHAGQLLAQQLALCAPAPPFLVLALPRGGVPVAYVVSQMLRAPLDVLAVRKLGMPQHPDYAIGAIASGGVRVMNPEAAFLNLPTPELEALIAREQQELQRRERLHRAGRPAPDLVGCSVILVDDGLATGSTMRAAIVSARRQGAPHITVALPVAASETADSLRREVEEVVCVTTPVPLRTIGLWYDDFEPVSDDAVRTLLASAQAGAAPS